MTLTGIANSVKDRLGIPVEVPLRDVIPTLRTKPVPDEMRPALAAAPSGPRSLLADLAVASQGHPFLKWWHYLDAYDSRLGEFAQRSRDGLLERPLRLLEIGIWKGGFLDVWREYFGPSAVIFGIDIEPATPPEMIHSAEVRVGSQADPHFLRSVVHEMGGLDVVIDDGSHVSAHVITSLRTLFPHLSSGGLYFIEDLHTSYWPAWGGGLRRRGTSIEALKSLVDELHQPYFERPASDGSLGITRDDLLSIQFFDSLAILEKGFVGPPSPFHGGRWPQ